MATTLFVVAVTPGTATAQSSDKQKVSVTVRFEVGMNNEQRVVAVRAAGEPPRGTTRLVDETGRNVLVLTPLSDPAKCGDTPTHDTGVGHRVWCFSVSPVWAGNSYKGDLVGSETVVTVTVTARHGPILPTVVVVGALILSGLLVWFATKKLPSIVTSALFWSATRSDGGITGLEAWATDAAGNRLSKADTLARVRWAKAHGKLQVRRDRSSLKSECDSSTLPGCPLKTEAEAEANRTDTTREDLLTDSGSRATSKASRLLALLAKADADYDEFIEVSTQLLERVPDANQAAAKQLVAQAKDRPKDYLSEITIDDVLDSYQQVLEQVRNYLPAGVAPPVSALALAGSFGGLGRAARIARVSRELATTAGYVLQVAATAGLVLATAAILMIVATVTVLVAQYFPNHSFGTWTDYLQLGAAALGSSAVAGILAALLLLRGPDPWYPQS